MAEQLKITYANMGSIDQGLLNAKFEEALTKIESVRGKNFPLLIGGKRVEASETFPVLSPMDTREPLFYFQQGGRKESKQAIEAAKSAFSGWRAWSWQDRCDLIDRVADMISASQFELAAAMVLEMGKNRLEALGDVEETADLLRYYALQMREHDGFVRHMQSEGPNATNIDVMKPYGVWSVIAPFNFPMALAGGPVGAALVTGNTVVVKPASDAPYTSFRLVEMFIEAGIPAGAVNFITGPGSTAGAELVDNPNVDGITFTGSYEVGFKQVYQKFASEFPKPVIVEMGGKNPAIISKNADLDAAAQGVMKSAFGMGGQKCSACSRVYVENEVFDTFVSKLVEKTKTIKVGDPSKDGTVFLGPLANKGGYEDYKRFMDKARADGKVVFGGEALTEGDYANGFFVQPAIITDLPQEHDLVQNELFVPIVYVTRVGSLAEAMDKANGTAYGLTAGFFSKNEDEVEWFLNNIEAGVVYVNRSAGATTGAWPGFQPFGGWKSSGSSGRNIGGYYTLLNYVREQSQTVIR